MAIVQGYLGTTDPAGLDALIEDCQATGFLDAAATPAAA